MTHTFPSIEDEAICIAFSGVFAIDAGCLDPLIESARDCALPLISDGSRLSFKDASGFAEGRGGGKGDTDIRETDAVWAL